MAPRNSVFALACALVLTLVRTLPLPLAVAVTVAVAVVGGIVLVLVVPVFLIFAQAAAVAASQRTLNPENQTYHVLMIVTDGVINDMGNTMNALVAAADLPFSVIMSVVLQR